MIEWLNLCRRQYNYRLGERFRWWEATRTSINTCPLNTSIVSVDNIYQNIPEYRVQVRDGRKLDKDGYPTSLKKEINTPNIIEGLCPMANGSIRRYKKY